MGGKENEVKYFGWFNGIDLYFIRDFGEIVMILYLVFYEFVEDDVFDVYDKWWLGLRFVCVCGLIWVIFRFRIFSVVLFL